MVEPAAMPVAPARAPSKGLVLAGAAIGIGAALALRALALARGNTRVPDGWVNAVALGVAVAALGFSLVERSPSRRSRLGRWSALAGGLLAGLALAAWVGLGNDVMRYHTWEHFHYYLGGKYFRELSYTRLYACTAVVEAERVGADAMVGRRMRDLVTDEVVPVEAALANPEDCRGRFTPERWRAFGDDVMWFRGATGAIWDRMQQDHGFNPPPTWVLAGGLLASLAPASATTQTALALVDPVLLVAMLALVGWAFGAHVLLVAIVVWGCQLPGQATWTAAAFLRQDWLLWLVASVCLARRGWPALAGVALASATAIRVFPVFLFGLPLVLIAHRTWRDGRLHRVDGRFLAGAAAGAIGWFGLSTAVFGLDAWSAFRDHIALHRLAPIANHVGLRALLSQSWAGRWVAARRPGAVDPFALWASMRRATFAELHGVYVALATGIVVLAGVAGWRLRRLWTAIAASAVLVVTAVDVASYYCAFFIVLGLLAATSRVEERLALAAIVVGRAANLLPIATENPDLRYSVQSAVFVVWALAALVLLAWRPRPRPVPVPASSAGTRASRRRRAR
jgi:hypothetical protein